MIERGRAVRERRETLGLSREDLSAATRVPLEHISAIEEGQPKSLPAGPYADAWLRALEAHLGLDSPPRTEAVEPEGGVPLWAVRAAAGVALGALVAVIAWQAFDKSPVSATPAPTSTDSADQELVVRALRNTSVRVVADGELVREGPIAGGEELVVNATERIELDVKAAGALRLDFNGDRVVPQGRQEGERRLVFVDDGGRR